ncbi:hypothetical protein D3C76_1229030 [compost metagenome]
MLGMLIWVEDSILFISSVFNVAIPVFAGTEKHGCCPVTSALGTAVLEQQNVAI